MTDESSTAAGSVTRSGSRPLTDAAVSDELIWALVDAAPDALVMVNFDGLIELVNCQTEELFGYQRSGLLGRPVEVLIPEQRRSVHRAHRTRYRVDPTPRAMGAGELLQGRRADGTEFPVEVSLSPVTTSEGRWILAAVRDVTERLESERHSRAIRHAIDTANDGLFIVDPATLVFTYVNTAGCDMHGYTAAEMLTMGPLHLAPELEREALKIELAPLMAGETETVTLRTCGLRRDGTEFPAEVLINRPVSVDHDGGRPLVAVVRDMTERVRFEQALADSQTRDEIFAERERFGRDLHDTVIGDLFAVGMSLQAGLTSTDAAHGVGAERAESAVEDIDQVISKIRNTIFTVKTPIEPRREVTEQLRQLVDRFEERLGYTPELTIDGNVDDLSGEVVEQLFPTVEEILSNVAKHAHSTSTDIYITVTDSLIVRVADNGVGCTTEVATNGGLGHSNLRRRAELLDGTCMIKPGQQSGLTVTWCVPLT